MNVNETSIAIRQAPPDTAASEQKLRSILDIVRPTHFLSYIVIAWRCCMHLRHAALTQELVDMWPTFTESPFLRPLELIAQACLPVFRHEPESKTLSSPSPPSTSSPSSSSTITKVPPSLAAAYCATLEKALDFALNAGTLALALEAAILLSEQQQTREPVSTVLQRMEYDGTNGFGMDAVERAAVLLKSLQE